MYDYLDKFTEEYCRNQPFYGNIRVTSHGNVVYRKSVGYADRDRGIHLNEDSRFTLYSLSKPFCAIALLLLRDRGLADIDRHPGEYVPEAAQADARVTLRQMLHHTSGLPDFEQNPDFRRKYAPARLEDLREHVKILCGEYPMCFEPGTSAMYCNVNFTLCALAVENIAGMPYPEFLRKEVLEPFGMKTALVDRQGLILPDRVQGYDRDGEKLRPVPVSYDWLYGAGDLIGSEKDVYCLHDAIRERKLLKPETWDEILTPSPLNGMGMGCTVSVWHGKRRITHNGGHTGFRTLHIQLPDDDFDMILLSNCGFGDARNAFAEAVHEAWYGQGNGENTVVEMDKGYAK